MIELPPTLSKHFGVFFVFSFSLLPRPAASITNIIKVFHNFFITVSNFFKSLWMPHNTENFFV